MQLIIIYQKKIKVIKTDVGDRMFTSQWLKINLILVERTLVITFLKNLLNTSDSNLTLLFICNVIKNAKDFHKIYNRKMNPSILKSYTVLKKEKILKKISSISTFKEF